MFGTLVDRVASPFRQCSTGRRSGPMKCGGKTTHSSRSICVKIMSRWIAVFSFGITTTMTSRTSVCSKKHRRELIDGRGARALAEAEHDEIAAQRMDVAALDACSSRAAPTRRRRECRRSRAAGGA